MLAVDTNVLVRYLIRDHPDQTARATKLVRSQAIWVSKTVLLETAWVLTKSYAYPPEKVAQAFRELLGLPTVSPEDDFTIVQALDWFERGIDFADALHLASSGFTMPFATFDEALVRKARRLTTPEIVSR
jgi:predicted nucleic-acid-binding protein